MSDFSQRSFISFSGARSKWAGFGEGSRSVGRATASRSDCLPGPGDQVIGMMLANIFTGEPPPSGALGEADVLVGGIWYGIPFVVMFGLMVYDFCRERQG